MLYGGFNDRIPNQPRMQKMTANGSARINLQSQSRPKKLEWKNEYNSKSEMAFQSIFFWN